MPPVAQQVCHFRRQKRLCYVEEKETENDVQSIGFDVNFLNKIAALILFRPHNITTQKRIFICIYIYTYICVCNLCKRF